MKATRPGSCGFDASVLAPPDWGGEKKGDSEQREDAPLTLLPFRTGSKGKSNQAEKTTNRKQGSPLIDGLFKREANSNVFPALPLALARWHTALFFRRVPPHALSEYPGHLGSPFLPQACQQLRHQRSRLGRQRDRRTGTGGPLRPCANLRREHGDQSSNEGERFQGAHWGSSPSGLPRNDPPPDQGIAAKLCRRRQLRLQRRKAP
jgi:hypothetical protein